MWAWRIFGSCLLAKTRVKLLVSPPSPLTRRPQSMRPFSVRVMTLSLEITCTTPPHPERQSRFTPARMHCAMTSKSSSGSKSFTLYFTNSFRRPSW